MSDAETDGEEFRERIREIREKRRATHSSDQERPLDDLEPRREGIGRGAIDLPDSGLGTGTDGLDVLGNTTPPRTKTVEPSVVQVCTECEVYYNVDGDWSVCPKCATDLLEVSHA